MKVTGRIVSIRAGDLEKKPRITIEINEKNKLLAAYDKLKPLDKLHVELKPWRKKRSLDANAYAWVLIDRLAEEMGSSKKEIYRRAIKDIGGNTDIVCVINSAVEKVCVNWEKDGLGWQTETFPSKIKGCTNVILYYGSSTFDSKQMSILIDRLIQDCEAVGIETEPPEKVKSLLEQWDGKKE